MLLKVVSSGLDQTAFMNIQGASKTPDNILNLKTSMPATRAFVLTIVMYSDVWSLVEMEYWSVRH
jgi:copper(I)-binding protein